MFDFPRIGGFTKILNFSRTLFHRFRRSRRVRRSYVYTTYPNERLEIEFLNGEKSRKAKRYKNL